MENSTIEQYVAEIQAAKEAEYVRLGYTKITPPIYSFKTSKRFYKVIQTETFGSGTCVHCFVEIATGDIYKAAGWNAPAKGVRGNLKNDRKPLLGYDFYR
jgi:hypothetical protein